MAFVLEHELYISMDRHFLASKLIGELKVHSYLYNVFHYSYFFNSSFNLGNSASKVLKSSEIRFLIFIHFSFYQLLNLTNYCSFSYFSKSVWFTALFEWRNVWEWYSQEWLPLFLQRKIHGKKLSRYFTHYSRYGVYIILPFLKKKNLQLIALPIVV